MFLMTLRGFAPALLVSSFLMAAGCGGGSGGGSSRGPVVDQSDNTPSPGPVPGTASCPAVFEKAGVPVQWNFTTLAAQNVNAGGGSVTLEYVLANAGETNSYFLYIPSTDPLAPVIILNEAYNGIDWTGEGVDAQFAALGPGKHPDSFAPAYNGQDLVRYSPETSAPDGGSLRASVNLWLESGFAVIKTYGRFYAGGALANDVSDAVAPWYFIADRASTFAGRQLFTTGGSWGGLMALYGAAAAPDSVVPTAVAVTSAPVDLKAVRNYAMQLPSDVPAASEEVNAFFSPYIRRIDASISRAGTSSSAPFDTTTLCSCLPDKVLAAHDDIDTIVPVAQTEQLQASCAGRVQPIFWRRSAQAAVQTAGLSHGDFGGRSAVTDVGTLVGAWIIDQADVEPTVIPVDPDSFSGFLMTVSDARNRGENTDYAIAALRPLLSGKVWLQSTLGSTQPQTGADFLAGLLNTLFGLQTTAESVEEALTANTLPF
ncbi:hypothetical protein [Allohahella marinimesophila]|uniref:Uncharacterized protein n=1 Tax=Allohahella marinimesophila TaxID=1054972 RepID=A0ABP7PLK8_9GAMM